MSQNLLAEAQWLRDNPHFSERPASIREFMGPDYLDLVDTIRPGVLEVLVEIFGEEVDPQWISVKRKAALTGSIGWGKCGTLDSMVNMSDGTYKRTADIRVGDRLPGGVVSMSEDNGVRPVYRLTTTWGQSIEVSENHPIWVEGRGWVEVHDVHEHDRVTLLRGWEAENPVDQDDHLYRLAGYMIADGGMTGSQPTWTKGNPHLEADMQDIMRRMGWTLSVKKETPNFRHYGIVSGGDARRLFAQWGIWGSDAHSKRVPEFVFRSSNDKIKQFLCAYLESDGHNDEHGANFHSVSRDMLADVQKLLLRLDVPCMLTVKNGRYKGERHVSWRLRVPAAGWNKVRTWDFKDPANRTMSFDYVDPDTIPLGLCGCGCGEETAVVKKAAYGYKRGDRKRFRRGHANRVRPEVLNPVCRVASVERVEDQQTWAIQVDPTHHLYMDDILTHNSTAASIILTYCVHWVQCLKDPQGFFGLMPGTRIAFMMMSTSERQAREVLFGDVKARVNHSSWFQRFCKFDPQFKNQLRFPRDIWIVPGGSEETRFEGYNILAGIIDEADSHKQTDLKDYAEQGLDTILNRITSRFPDYEAETHRGLIVVIGQMKSATGFMHRIYTEWKKDTTAATRRVMLWESLGWHKFTENPADIAGGRETAPRKSFVYDVDHKRIIPTPEARSAGIDFHTPDSGYIEVPTAYLTDFRRDPIKALKDLAGIPPEASDPFIALPDRILACQEHWHARFGDDPRVGDEPTWPKLRMPHATDGIKRVVHLDLAVSGQGDALGLAMGHVAGIVDVDGEEKPLIVFDLLMRIHAPSGGEIILGDVRRVIYRLARDLGYPIKLVTADGFSSVDTLQQMRKAKINADYLSVDKTKQPYEDLREAIYDERVLFPKYLSRIREGDTEPINIAYRELSQLSDVGMKIDHPTPGCFVGETRIPTLDGQYPQISELEGKETWVYSCAQDGTVVPGRARGRMTKEVSELVDVILDNGYVARCTPEHPWMLRDGTYKAAAELEPGVDRLMPINFSWPVDGGYTRITHPNGERQSGHRMVAEHMSGRKVRPTEIVHHVNRVKIDNRPENLEIIDESDHKTEHANEFWSGKESAFREGYNTWLSSPRKDEMYARRRNPGWTAGKDLEAQRQVIESRRNFRSDITLEVMATVMRALTANEASRMLGCGRNVIIARLTQGGYKDWDDFKARHGDNHKVRAVIPVHLDRPVPVYDLEVDEWSNFALPGGVFVHNSKDVADAMAGVVHVLMTQIQYRRGALHVAHPAPDREAPLASQVQAESLGSQGESLAQVIMGGRDAPAPWSGGDPTSSGPSFEDWLARYGQPAQGASGPPVVELPRRTD